MADIAFLERELAITRQALTGVQRAIALAEQSGEFTGELREQERRYQEQISSLLQQLSAAQSTTPVESSGETVKESQKANDAAADTQAPDTATTTADTTGTVGTPNAATVPSNASLTESENIPSLPPAPAKLPAGRVTDGNTSAPAPTGSAAPRPATQVSQTNTTVTAPDKNNNLVSNIYRAVRVISNFRQGKFTQDVEGVQMFFNVPPRVGAATSGRVGGSEAIRDETGRVSTIRRNTETGELYVGTPGVVYADDPPQTYETTGVTPTGQAPESSRVATSDTSTAAADVNPPATIPLSTRPPTSGTTNVGVATTPGTQPVDTAATSTTERQQGAWEP